MLLCPGRTYSKDLFRYRQCEILFQIENSAFQRASGSQNILAGVQGIHTAPLGGGTQFQGTFPVTVKFHTHGTPAAGGRSQGDGVVQTGADWDSGGENGTLLVGNVVQNFTPHGDDITHDPANCVGRQQKTNVQNRLQQYAAAVAQAVLNGHGSRYDEIQGMGVELVLVSFQKGNFDIGDLPSQTALIQCNGQCLNNLILIPLLDFPDGDFGFKNHTAAPGTRFNAEFQNGPAWLGCNRI